MILNEPEWKKKFFWIYIAQKKNLILNKNKKLLFLIRLQFLNWLKITFIYFSNNFIHLMGKNKPIKWINK